MKKILATLFLVPFYFFANAQFTAGTSGNTILTNIGDNVGMGIATPALKVHVVGALGFPVNTGTAQTGVLRLQGTGASGVLDFSVNGSSGSSLQATASNSLSATYPLLLNPNGGNVGIGTTSPASKLHIASSASLSLTIEATGAGRTQSYYKTPTANFATGINTDDHFGIVPNTFVNGATGMWMNSSGNVAIGTVDPQGYMLAVNGSVISTAMTVKLFSNWPDYVFKPSYPLVPLNELSAYITANRHLPGMPTTADVEKNGLDLGEINQTLVKKVEELTLYLIDKDKQIQNQQQAIQQVQQQLTELVKQVKTLQQAPGKK